MNVGGPAIHCDILSGLNPNEFQIELFAGQCESNEEKYKTQNGFLIWESSNLKKSINFKQDYLTIKILLGIIEKQQPDIIHTHLSKAGFVGRIAGIIYNLTHKKKIKLVHTFHGTIFKHYFGWFKSKLYLYIERLLAHFTDRIIAISESQKLDLVKLGFKKKKITVIKLGIDLEPFLYERNFEDKKTLKVGIIGRLEPIKNHKMFLDAIARYKENGMNNLKFYIIGNGSLYEDLFNYSIQLGIQDIVYFIATVFDRYLLAGYYSSFDCIVNCSLNEGTPLSLIEAMASECLVIATDVGGTKDLMGKSVKVNSAKYCNNGYLIESNNYKQLAMMLRYFYLMHDSAQVERRIKRAKQYVIENHSKERLLEDISSLYKELM